MTPHEVARAFSSHRFEDAWAQLADDVRWTLPGAATIEGREAVVEACEQTTSALAGTRTTFSRFVVVVGDGAVAIDSVASYEAPDGSADVVASCDIYEFDGDLVRAITSYSVELVEPAPAP